MYPALLRFVPSITLARIDVLPDDGPVGPKHVGVINVNVLISVKSFIISVKSFKV